jgi:hypothetical protein
MVVMKPLVLPSEMGHEIPSIHAATDRLWEVPDMMAVLETKSDSCSLTDVGLI